MDDREIQELLDSAAATRGVAGAQLTIFDGEKEREFVTGFRNVEQRLPVTPETLFQIGSTTKILNAALVMAFVDEIRLELDEPVRAYLPEFKLTDEPAAQQITLRHLLSMTAGIDNGHYYDFGRGNDALERSVSVLGGIPHIFAPGTAFGYSNASSNIAGLVAARVAGRTWEDLLIERICAPLGLHSLALFAEDVILHPHAIGYQKIEGSHALERTPIWCLTRSIAPAGGLTCCSATGLIRVARMFLDRGCSADGTAVISEAASGLMLEPQVKVPTRWLADEWCLGPMRKSWGGTTIHGHSGTNVGGSSTLLWSQERRFAVATTVNVGREGYPLTSDIFDVLFPKLFGLEKPAALTTENVVRVDVEPRPYVGRFEAFGMCHRVEQRDQGLALLVNDGAEVIECELIPLGDDRFLPTDPRISAQRGWDIAFWGDDGCGRFTHMLQGIFPLRRTG